MRPDLSAHAADQNGLFTRRQAMGAGYSERELRTLTGVHGAWVVVRRGVYMERVLWDSLPPYDGEFTARDWAAHLNMTRMHVMSHDSAARAHGLPMLQEHRELVHVTRPTFIGSRTEAGVKHHLARHEPITIETVAGLPVTGLARTALDVAREHGSTAGIAACDAALRRGATMDDFYACLAQMRCWPRITQAHAAVEVADPGAENIAESLGRELAMELGFGVPATQFPVNLGHSVAWIDLRMGRHLIEIDGRQKYVDASRGGVATESAERVVWDERMRQTDVCAKGFGMSRLSWTDFFGRRREEALARLRREYAVTYQRFGDKLNAEMSAFEEQMRNVRRERIMRDNVDDNVA